MFRPVHPDIQTPDIWLCQRCDAPQRYREIETRSPQKPARTVPAQQEHEP
jgi:hypothetical protein